MISQSPYKFQTDTGNIQSIDWSVIAFFIFMIVFIATAILTGVLFIFTIIKKRGRF